ncbi:MAG TPA: 2OG-Fe(II) oxygenase [Candidatus Tenderia electrophaga]|uniref:2OG-Fe(II) oxygenase n=1 Tax=Candidatus Tenderia electrophaga TaxID=1748243 RepID=A0A832N647_9GAMM|nr:2OG-Fe(II) oxygenase [Candidatus Tenderia electrophaga]
MKNPETIRQNKQQKLIDELVEQRISITPNFFDADLIASLHQELVDLEKQDQLRAAHIGKHQQRSHIRDIRGDAIHWINGETEAQKRFLAEMSQLQDALNQQLFLGLTELESHYAYYPPGMGYQKHLDSFQNNNLRRITIVVYLNPDWQAEDGGELLTYNTDEITNRVLPLGGTLVCFVSEEIPHQVAITKRERFSIAGWFRVRDTGG